MVNPLVAETNHAVAYDIQLGRRPPRSVCARFPAITVRTTAAQTAMRCRVEEQRQLDQVLAKLCSMALVLTEVHRLPVADRDLAGAATYEVRVAGELGERLLRHLRLPHYAVPERTVVRLTGAPDELHRFLEACTDTGASIERVRRVEDAG